MVEPKQNRSREANAASNDPPSTNSKKSPSTAPRKIQGNLPYLTASGTLKKVLDRIIEASRPDKFNADFLENVLKLPGGSPRATIPILKRTGFLTSDGAPTELYARFRTDGGRGLATLTALKNGFGEIFKRSEYAHSVDDNKIRDIIMEVTGLKSSDAVAIAIKGTFNVLKSYIPTNFDPSSALEDMAQAEDATEILSNPTRILPQRGSARSGEIGLRYNINIILPETSDLRVLNAIFRSIKENLM